MATRAMRLPDVGEGIAEAEVVRWLVEVGDRVREGDPVVEVMTDKATVELPTPFAGTVEHLAAEPGELVAVGADLLHLRVEDAAGPTAAGNGSGPQEVRSTGTAQVSSTAATTSPTTPPTTVASPTTTAPVAPTPQRPAARRGERPTAAPAVRRRARQLGIDLAGLQGTGPGGRIVHEDLDRVLVARQGAPATGAPATGAPGAGAPTTGADPFADRHGDGGEVEQVRLTGLRRRIAAHMEESARRIPHFSYVEEVDVTELQRTRAVLAREWADRGAAPGVLPFVLRATVLAVADHPEMNARHDDEQGVVTRHRRVHLGVAVQTDDGLVVAVLRDAHTMGAPELAAELERVAARARRGDATLAELRGSTITVSSLGALGGIASTPIINHPEVAIVGVNKIQVRPTWVDGAVVPREVMHLSSSFDHRVVDGWHAARFVQRIRELLETPALLFTPGSVSRK